MEAFRRLLREEYGFEAPDNLQSAWIMPYSLRHKVQSGVAAGALEANRICAALDLASPDTSQHHGVTREDYDAAAAADFWAGVNLVELATPVAPGYLLKAYYGGRAGAANTAELAAGEILEATAGVAFTNQPTNDGVELVSSSTSDTAAVTVEIIGHTAGTVTRETVALNGTTFVPTVKTDWDDVLAVKVLTGTLVGTLTVREASGNATIVTLAPAVTQAGVLSMSSGDGYAVNKIVNVKASGASTAKVGVYGRKKNGDFATEAIALNGTTNVPTVNEYVRVTEFYVGAVAADRNVSATRSATLDSGLVICGRALQTEGDGELAAAFITL